MSDIAKCNGHACDKRTTCYRFTAPANPHWQAYLTPLNPGPECESYWKLPTPQSPERITR